jgi:hypothetical protein
MPVTATNLRLKLTEIAFSRYRRTLINIEKIGQSELQQAR